MADFLSFIADQQSKSDLADWAARQAAAGKMDPGYAELAAADPDSFRTHVLPNLYKTDQTKSALADFYGKGQSQQLPQGIPLDADSSLPQQMQPPQDQSALKKIAAIANLPPALQTLAAQQLAFDSNPSVNSDLTGEDFLKTLHPNIAAQVKGIAEGKIQYPSTSRQNPMNQMLRGAVEQYEPGFDATLWNQRNKTAQDFNSTGGKSRQNITAIETAINHLAQLQDASEQLGGVDNGWIANAPVNTALNLYHSLASDPELKTYKTVQKTAADEVAKATAGPGGSTVGDREERQSEFSPNAAPKARQAAFQSALQLMAGRLEPLASNYNNAMRTTLNPTELLSPEAQKNYARIMGSASPNSEASGNYQPSALAKMADPSQGITPDMARAELARRKNSQ